VPLVAFRRASVCGAEGGTHGIQGYVCTDIFLAAIRRKGKKHKTTCCPQTGEKIRGPEEGETRLTPVESLKRQIKTNQRLQLQQVWPGTDINDSQLHISHKNRRFGRGKGKIQSIETAQKRIKYCLENGYGTVLCHLWGDYKGGLDKGDRVDEWV